jgi:acyl-CoA dehydrogenase
MRSIGKAEMALELMVKRAASREAFGRPIVRLGGNLEIISRARIDINAMRLSVLQAAKAMDVLGNKEARVYVSAVKAMVPERVCQIIDAAIQMHGATGVSQWTPLAGLYTDMRHLRFADGPDEVHHMVVGRAEVNAYGGRVLLMGWGMGGGLVLEAARLIPKIVGLVCMNGFYNGKRVQKMVRGYSAYV